MARADRAFAPAMASIPELSDPASAGADFRVEKKEARNWRISLLSLRAGPWFDAKFARGKPNTRAIETNLAGANDFIREARIGASEPNTSAPSLCPISDEGRFQRRAVVDQGGRSCN